MKVALLVDDTCAAPRGRGGWALIERHERRIYGSLKRSGHEVLITPVLESLDELAGTLDAFKPGVVFNVTEGYRSVRRYDALVADFVSACGYPMTGNHGMCLRICRDKAVSKHLLKAVGVPVPKFLEARKLSDLKSRFLSTIPYPVIVKPLSLDASEFISRQSVCFDAADAVRRAKWLLEAKEEPAIIEEYINGRELAIPFTRFRNVRFYPPRELMVPEGYVGLPVATIAIKERRNRSGCQPKFMPAILRQDEVAAVSRVVRKAASALGITSYARVDLILKSDGTPVVVEVNANCGLVPRAFGLLGAGSQRKFDALISAIVRHPA